MELLAADFDPSDHFVVHPCGHWVVKRLLTSEEIGGGGEGGNGEEGGEGEEGGGEERENEDEKRGGSGEKETGGDEIEKTRSFAEMILEGVSEDNIRAWTNTNRGAFIVCRLSCMYTWCVFLVTMILVAIQENEFRLRFCVNVYIHVHLEVQFVRTQFSPKRETLSVDICFFVKFTLVKFLSFSLPLSSPLPPSLLSSKVNGVREKTKTILEPALKTIRTGTLEGQKALWKDINSNNNKTNH